MTPCLRLSCIACVAAIGCFTPADETLDGGRPRSADSGVAEVDAGAMDAGVARRDCAPPPDAGRLSSVVYVPDGCTHYKGDVLVVGVAGGEIADSPTSNVSSLVEIEGILSVQNVFMTANLRGFGNLERVSEVFVISYSDLPSVSAVSRLKEVGSMTLLTAHGLRDVELSSLEVIHGDFGITDNAELESLAGLTSLRVIEGRLILSRNPKLKSAALSAFTSRVVIDGGIVRQ